MILTKPTKEGEFIECSLCGKNKHSYNILDNGICKACNKKIQAGKVFKICPICGEQIKYTAIKCRFCNEMVGKSEGHLTSKVASVNKIEEENLEGNTVSVKENKTNLIILGKESFKSPIFGFVLGILSIFFASIGIIPVLAIIFSISAIIKYKQLSMRDKWFSIIGLFLGVIYFIVNLAMYRHI